jgi:cbb3-type cytochrome oxidase subunit 3
MVFYAHVYSVFDQIVDSILNVLSSIITLFFSEILIFSIFYFICNKKKARREEKKRIVQLLKIQNEKFETKK